MQRLSLDEWDEKVARHLDHIEMHARFIVMRAHELEGLPDWDTFAVDQLEQAQTALTRALGKLGAARKIMEDKDRVS